MNTASSVSYASHLMSGESNPNHVIHILEFSELSKRIAIETINDIVPSMVEGICLKVIKEYLNSNLNGSLRYDVKSVANVSIKDFNTMFKSEAFSSFVSNAVTEEIRKRINEIEINIK